MTKVCPVTEMVARALKNWEPRPSKAELPPEWQKVVRKAVEAFRAALNPSPALVGDEDAAR